MKKKRRAFAAIVTAFNEDESLNLEATRKQMRRQISAGNNLFCCGTNGDFSSLSNEEKVIIVKAALEEIHEAASEKENGGDIKVYANTGCPSTYETLRLSERMVNLGVDAIAIVAPYFISCEQENLYWHYKYLSERIGCPVYIYDIPSGTHNPFEPETVKKLAELPNIRGIKDTSGKIDNLQFYCDLKEQDPGFEVFVGPDHLIYEGLSMGVNGCVSGMANVFPERINSIVTLYDKGEREKAETVQRAISKFREELYTLGFPPALVKRALFTKYPEVGNNRMPAYLPNEKNDEIIIKLMKKYEEQ